MKRLIFSLLFSSAITGYAQQPPADPGGMTVRSQSSSGQASNTSDNSVPNPFADLGVKEMMMDMDMGMGMGMGGSMPGMAGGSMSGGMDSMDDYGMMAMGGGYELNPESQFRNGLRRAIVAIGKAESTEEREVLRQYVRQALEKRYQEMIASRKRELDKLRQSIATLETDLKRREHAKDRVIDVQMQSVQLAAEGLLQLGDLGGENSGLSAGDYSSGFGADASN